MFSASVPFLRPSCSQAGHSRLQPAAQVAHVRRMHGALKPTRSRTAREHPSGAMEGLSIKVNPSIRRTYALKRRPAYELALRHNVEICQNAI